MALEAKFTAKVDSHRVNPNYKVLLVNLLNLPEFHYRIEMRHGVPVLTKANLVPRNDWLLDVVEQMCRWKPTEFFPKLSAYVDEVLLNG